MSAPTAPSAPTGSLVGKLLVRGMLAGLIAGLFAFAVAYVAGEPSVNASIAVEEAAAKAEQATAHDHGGGHGAAEEPAEEEEIVSRDMQSTAGLATGVLVYGVALGGIASLAFCFVLGRVGRFTPKATAALVATAAFTTVYLVPFLKYPATPPAVGNPDTIGKRTTLFFLMILLSVLLGIAAVIAGRRLAPRLGNGNATVVAGAGFVAAVVIACAVLPANDDAVKPDFPAAVLWDFRLATLGIQAVLWAVFGLAFGLLAQRLLAPGPAAAQAVRAATPAA
ncbi:CbtA family protein [Streptomyces roseicoloratus]|uniref:CbtA family protein n=1 Tax=Streptomyces roseicoloratus TaxID=2508722 RepID=A0ABY9RYD7_9ACTN|nr:CbtA family protein [Streptomyces roseicoloratus]WMX46199.1 CbtA family protein [Streptomyces roseicoloratus]